MTVSLGPDQTVGYAGKHIVVFHAVFCACTWLLLCKLNKLFEHTFSSER